MKVLEDERNNLLQDKQKHLEENEILLNKTNELTLIMKENEKKIRRFTKRK